MNKTTPTQSAQASWKKIPGFGGAYEISESGSVRSVMVNGRPRKSPLYMRPAMTNSGYFGLSLRQGGENRKFTVHGLVLACFGNPRPEGFEASHLDGNPLNNHISNLCWQSKSDNNALKAQHGTLIVGEQHHSSKLTKKAVLRIRGSYQAKNRQGYCLLASEYGVSEQTIYKVIARRSWKHI